MGPVLCSCPWDLCPSVTLSMCRTFAFCHCSPIRNFPENTKGPRPLNHTQRDRRQSQPLSFKGTSQQRLPKEPGPSIYRVRENGSLFFFVTCLFSPKPAATGVGALLFRKGLTGIILLGKRSDESPWRNSPRAPQQSTSVAPHHGSLQAWDPTLAWTQVFSICLERFLVAFQGSPVTEQGMIKTWLRGVVTLRVLRRNYLILDSSQDS